MTEKRFVKRTGHFFFLPTGLGNQRVNQSKLNPIILLNYRQDLNNYFTPTIINIRPNGGGNSFSMTLIKGTKLSNLIKSDSS